ncbi:hypothetical protein T02_13170 [Trichinella nativa]|uniref:Uncharacterized protein n=1 Tax=Trichinella nativa TaxID=6335 RepID=A0A0V1KK64_9BILA|nr:hypothetical protein T02_3814 [Trichinella nativa]KRZ50410.1 hypothetical protein T02_13170 [Trichinella nativa]
MLPTFFEISREIRNWTLLIVSDGLMQIYCIFGGSDFSGKLQNFIAIITRSCSYSYEFSAFNQSPQPAQNEALLQ